MTTGTERCGDPSVQSGTSTRFYGSMRDDPEQNAGTIYESSPEQLLALKAPCRDNPEQKQAGREGEGGLTNESPGN